ncbi:MAG: hypothetical protein PHO37_00370 [Kiritimatiellae bacterium]|nr:hypothetical protein [Kiritimatiellia bacterium]
MYKNSTVKNLLAALAVLSLHPAIADITPDAIEFRRTAVQRMIFDRSQNIPLAALNPSKVIGLELMHPSVGAQSGKATASIKDGKLVVSAKEESTVSHWVGGFNPFATYDLAVDQFSGSGSTGMIFCDRNQSNKVVASLVVANSACSAVRWSVIKDGSSVETQEFKLPSGFTPDLPIRLRVQMLAMGATLFVEKSGESQLIGQTDLSKHFDLRRKDLMRSFDFAVHNELNADARVVISEATAALTPGCGQADIRAMTHPNGEPLLDEGRLWITMSVRGRTLPQQLQGVFSLNPSVFDVRFEGIIVFDMGDGLLRNELASHIFYDDAAKEWRGWTTGFSAFGSDSRKEEKAILAVASKRDPRRGFSIMRAYPMGLKGEHEDPHGVFDKEAGKWRLLLSEHFGKYKAGMWESDHWDRGYQRLSGPVTMDSTGTMIQKIGSKRYAIFGSADRKIYIHSYPDLKPAGELKMHLPPWTKKSGTRVWPNVIPLPEGYPSRYIALMMDRLNFPGMQGSNWSYGAMYLYHGDAPADDRTPYEYEITGE